MRSAPLGPQTLWAVLHPATSWPWYLLYGTMLVALGTVATAMYLTAMPARAAIAPVPAACAADAAQPAPAACRPGT
jgi:hypothetical protein